MSLLFTHFSHEPATSARSVSQRDAQPYSKPRGFWVSDETCKVGWREWCLVESFGLGSLTHVHDVRLKPSASVLRLSGGVELDAFTDQYGAELCSGSSIYIDWRLVAKDAQGIIITPYIWSRRLDGRSSGWYYSWDCASGCIWDADAIESVALREVVSPEQIAKDKEARDAAMLAKWAPATSTAASAALHSETEPRRDPQ